MGILVGNLGVSLVVSLGCKLRGSLGGTEEVNLNASYGIKITLIRQI